MKLHVSDQAAAWYVDELNLKPGEGVRFIGKVYGKTAVHEGMSLGIQKTFDVPEKTAALEVIDGRNYWVGIDDGWFFGDFDLDVQWNDKLSEPRYDFLEDGVVQVDSTSGASQTDGDSSASVHDEP